MEDEDESETEASGGSRKHFCLKLQAPSDQIRHQNKLI